MWPCLRENYLIPFLELIITSGGENIAPVPIENRIKSEVPFLSNVFVVGDKRKYLSCLVTLLVNHQILSSPLFILHFLKTETDPETGEPLDELSAFAKMQVDSLGSHNTTVSGIRDPKDIAVYDAIQEGIQRANLQAISNAQRVRLETNKPSNNLFNFRSKSLPFCRKTFQLSVVNWVGFSH